MTQKKRLALAVLGMHRSGTSALAGFLHHLGVSMGTNLMEPRRNNRKGFFEDLDVVRINDGLLRSQGGKWDRPGRLDQDRFPDSLWSEAVALIQQKFHDDVVFGLKDPRLCLLFPFWKTVLENQGIEVKAILTYRNPFEVSASLRDRDWFPQNLSLALWARYYCDAESYSRGSDRVFVAYQDLLHNARGVAFKLESALHFQFPKTWDSAEAKINGFLTPQLNRHQAAPRRASPAWSEVARLAQERVGLEGSDSLWRVNLDRAKAAYDSSPQPPLPAARDGWLNSRAMRLVHRAISRIGL